MKSLAFFLATQWVKKAVISKQESFSTTFLHCLSSKINDFFYFHWIFNRILKRNRLYFPIFLKIEVTWQNCIIDVTFWNELNRQVYQNVLLQNKFKSKVALHCMVKFLSLAPSNSRLRTAESAETVHYIYNTVQNKTSGE